jgi:hypothetical protein
MCKLDLASSVELPIQNCRGVLLEQKQAGLRAWRYGLKSCGSSFEYRAEDTTWESAIIALFGTDPRRLPKSEGDIKSRLRQADNALELRSRLGQIFVVSGHFETDEQCQLLRCDAYNVTMLKLSTGEEFSASLRRASIQMGVINRLTLSGQTARGV